MTTELNDELLDKVAGGEKQPIKKAYIDIHECIKCGYCLDECGYEAIFLQNDNYVVNKDLCQGCGTCVAGCPIGIISFVD